MRWGSSFAKASEDRQLRKRHASRPTLHRPRQEWAGDWRGSKAGGRDGRYYTGRGVSAAWARGRQRQRPDGLGIAGAASRAASAALGFPRYTGSERTGRGRHGDPVYDTRAGRAPWLQEASLPNEGKRQRPFDKLRVTDKTQAKACGYGERRDTLRASRPTNQERRSIGKR